MESKKKECTNIDISERPISTSEEDALGIENRIVNRIYDFINEISSSQLTLAITGEWGQGKSSVINLLSKKLKNKPNHIVITFEPLLEGKLEIVDIINLFYLKLYQNVTQDKPRKAIKKILKSVAILSRAKFIGRAEVNTEIFSGVRGKLGGGIEYDLGKNIDDVLKLFEDKQPKSLAEQTRELNKVLIDIKLFVIIDEIDRLPAKYIINFLMFCRILECFDNLISIVGIDYEQVIAKLINELTPKSESFSYQYVKNYIDKLFQIKFHVQHNRYQKIKFAKSKLIQIDKENVLSGLIESSDYNIQSELEGVVGYLATPRQLKKWLILIKANYFILKNMPDKLVFMKFLAVLVKHPLVLDYMSKYGVPYLLKGSMLPLYIREIYKIDFQNEGSNYIPIIIACLGMSLPVTINNQSVLDSMNNLTREIGIQKIDDIQAAKYVSEYLKSPLYLIYLFVEGAANEDYIALYKNFSNENINKALETMLKNEAEEHRFADDIAETLADGKLIIKQAPKLELIIDLWNNLASENSLGDPYTTIISYCIRMFSIEDIINHSPCALSEELITRVLNIFNIKNENGQYNLQLFYKPEGEVIIRKGMQNMTYIDIPLNTFELDTIKKIMNEWISKVDKDLGRIDISVFSQKCLINVFYGYVLWGQALGYDNREKLAAYIIKFLRNTDIHESSKLYLIAIIERERTSYDVLFNNDSTLIALLDDLKKKN